MSEEVVISDLAIALISRIEDEGLSKAKICIQNDSLLWTVEVYASALHNNASSHGVN